MSLTFKYADFSVKSTPDDSREITGYASTFNGVDAFGDSIAPGAFTETIQKHRSSDSVIPLLFEHDRKLDAHVGEILEMTEDDNGLYIRARLDDNDSGNRAYNLVKGRRVKGLSIGFYPLEVVPGEIDGTAVTSITKIDLQEISLVLSPADSRAQITSVKSALGSDTQAPATPVISSRELSTLTKGLTEGGDLSSFHDSLDRQLELLESKAAADLYFETMITNGAIGARSGGHKLTPEQRSKVEAKAILHIIRTAEQRGTGLTQKDVDQIALIRKAPASWQHAKKSAETVDKIKAALGNSLNTSEERNTVFPLTKSNARTVAAHALTEIHQKSLNGKPSAQLAVDYDTQDVFELERPAVNILELITGAPVYNSPVLSYMRQTDRDLRAAIVPTGEAKPISKLGYERVDTTLQVVAHIVREIDQYILKDVDALRSLIESEMIAGVVEQVERWLVQELYRADGHQLQAFQEDPFTTVRLGLSGLQSIGLEAGAIVLHPDTWARMETTKATGDGQFVFNGAPVNQDQRLLWGVPVVTSVAIPVNSGLAFDRTSARVYHDSTLDIAWNVSGDEFERNQLAIRAEGRFRPVVTRGPGIVELLLDPKAEPLHFDDPVPNPLADDADNETVLTNE